MKTRIVVLLVISFVLSCCKKDDDQPQPNNLGPYEMTGYYYQNCDNIPISGVTVSLYEEEFRDIFGNISGGELARTETDENGYFEFRYGTKGGRRMSIKNESIGGFDVLKNISPKSSYEDVLVYNAASTNIIYDLEVINSYTSQDTLFYANANGDTLIIGPFKSGRLAEFYNVGFLNFTYNGVQVSFRYSISTEPTDRVETNVISNFCADTTRIIIRLD